LQMGMQANTNWEALRKGVWVMLVLNRKAGEQVMIGDDIVIYFLSAGSGYSRIGIDAPKEIKIVRNEISHKLPKDGEVNDD